MNNTISLEQISKTGIPDSKLILRQYKIDLMARFMIIKSINPKLGQSEIAKELGYSSDNLQRYKNDRNMLSPYKIPPDNTNKRRQKISIREHDLEGTQMTSNDLKRRQMTSEDVNEIYKIV